MRRPRSWILGSFALAVVALFTGACDRQSASPSDHDPPPIVFGVDRDLPPYSFVDESGAVRGLSVDLLRSIFDKLGSPLEIQAVASEDLHDRLESGAVDALAHVPYTDHLAERFLLSLPHTDVSDAFFVRVDTEPGEGESGDVESAWLQERTVVVLRDDPSYDFAARWAAEEDLRAEPSVARALRVLASGEADLALLPMEPALLLAKRLRLSQVRVLPNAPVDYTRGLSFAVRPDHGALLEDLERGLMIVTREGAYLEIYNRWQTDPGDSSRLLNLLTWTLLPTAALMLLFGGWSFALRRTVAARTRELERAAADRRALERRIQRAGKLQSLGALAGGVAHDFNNLLTVILGNLELARLRAPDAPIHDLLDEASASSRRAAELCRLMLATSGRGRVADETVDLCELTAAVADAARDDLPPGVQLELALSRRLPELRGDPEQIRQAIEHLLQNALESVADHGGRVVLRTSVVDLGSDTMEEASFGNRVSAGAFAALEVIDDGPGIPKELADRIFEPFFSTRFTGRGLGLPATLGIARGHGGGVTVHDTAGGGATLRLLLPVGRRAPADVSPPPEPAAGNAR